MANEIMVQDENAISENVRKTNDFEIPRGYICTVDISSFKGKMAVMNALNGSESLSDYMNDAINVVDIVTTSGVRSRTGEECVNTYLILDDGRALFSQSDGVHRAVCSLVALFTVNGVCDFGDGIAIKCIEQKLRNGNTLKTLVPADM